ncbi:MAG: hypothetical protein WBA91_05315, partial [Paracoccaceae bacterium]
GAQGRFLGLNGGQPAVDQVFRYEDIDRFVHFLEERLGCEVQLPHLNVSPKGDIALTLQAEERLRAHFAEEYGFYNQLD